MITALVDTLAEKLALEERLRINLTEVQSISATQRALRLVNDATRAFTAELEVCTPYLNSQVIANLRTEADVIARELSASRQRFATNRKEQLPIYNAGEKLKRASAGLAQQWQLHAQARLAPYVDLLRLVTYVPEVAASASEINTLVGQIKAQVTTPPRTQTHLEQFHQKLDELGRRLDAIARLPESVRTFLSNVVGGSATLADLTPEVRAWIDDGNRATAFAITFSQRRS